ncbi:uncharacterized protein LOC134648306 [Cydia amplana]|uniref:uncharacterized protein LOC134648306 n=1 Tax=Cydia amplana TaxID=1869771 RepID=UPI002FE4FF41
MENVVEYEKECVCRSGGTLDVLKEVQRAYEVRLELVERVGGVDTVQTCVIMQMQARVLRSWVSDLVAQNALLVRAVEELERETTSRAETERRRHAESYNGTERQNKNLELSLVKESLQNEVTAKDREMKRLKKELQQHEQPAAAAAAAAGARGGGTPNVQMKDAEVMAGMCCTGAECGDLVPVQDIEELVREEADKYRERIRNMEISLQSSGVKLRAVHKLNLGLIEELSSLRRLVVAIDVERRDARVKLDLQRTIVKQMVRQLLGIEELSSLRRPVVAIDVERRVDGVKLAFQRTIVKQMVRHLRQATAQLKKKELDYSIKSDFVSGDNFGQPMSLASLPAPCTRQPRPRRRAVPPPPPAGDPRPRTDQLDSSGDFRPFHEDMLSRKSNYQEKETGGHHQREQGVQRPERADRSQSDEMFEVEIAAPIPGTSTMRDNFDVADRSCETLDDARRIGMKLQNNEPVQSCDEYVCVFMLIVVMMTMMFNGLVCVDSDNSDFTKDSGGGGSSCAGACERYYRDKLIATLQILENKEETIRVQGCSLGVAEGRIAELTARARQLRRELDHKAQELSQLRQVAESCRPDKSDVSIGAEIKGVEGQRRLVQTLEDNLAVVTDLYRECFYEAAKQEELIDMLRKSYLDVRLMEKAKTDKITKLHNIINTQKRSIEQCQDVVLEVESLKSEISSFLNSSNNDSGMWERGSESPDVGEELADILDQLRQLQHMLTVCSCVCVLCVCYCRACGARVGEPRCRGGARRHPGPAAAAATHAYCMFVCLWHVGRGSESPDVGEELADILDQLRQLQHMLTGMWGEGRRAQVSGRSSQTSWTSCGSCNTCLLYVRVSVCCVCVIVGHVGRGSESPGVGEELADILDQLRQLQHMLTGMWGEGRRAQVSGRSSQTSWTSCGSCNTCLLYVRVSVCCVCVIVGHVGRGSESPGVGEELADILDQLRQLQHMLTGMWGEGRRAQMSGRSSQTSWTSCGSCNTCLLYVRVSVCCVCVIVGHVGRGSESPGVGEELADILDQLRQLQHMLTGMWGEGRRAQMSGRSSQTSWTSCGSCNTCLLYVRVSVCCVCVIVGHVGRGSESPGVGEELADILDQLRQLQHMLTTDCTCGLQEENSSLKERNITLEAELEQVRQRNKELEESLRHILSQRREEQIKEKEQETEEAVKKLAEVENTCKERGEACETLKRQLQQARVLLDDKTAELVEAQTTSAAKDVTIRGLQQNLEHSEKLVQEGLKKLSEVGQSRSELLLESQARISELERRLKLSARRCGDLEAGRRERERSTLELQACLEEAHARGARLCEESRRVTAGIRQWMREKKQQTREQQDKIKMQKFRIRELERCVRTRQNNNLTSQSDTEPSSSVSQCESGTYRRGLRPMCRSEINAPSGSLAGCVARDETASCSKCVSNRQQESGSEMASCSRAPVPPIRKKRQQSCNDLVR